MADNVTRCPKCATSFRISDAHLSSAKGSVRCGSCLSVFDAKKHLIPPQEEKIHTSEAPQEDDDILISDTMEIGTVTTAKIDDFPEEFSEGMFAGTDTADSEFNLFEREALQDDEDDDVPQDESWALDLLNDDEPETEKPEASSEDIHSPSEAQTFEEESPSHFNQNSFQIIEDEAAQSSPQSAKDLFNEYDDVEIEEFDYSDNSQVYAQPLSATGTDYLAAIEPEPVEFDWHGQIRFWQSRKFWACLSLAAGVVLLGQIAWIKMPTLSLIEPYRSYYAQICQSFSCSLPELIDRSKIRSANLIVRSHPKVPNALIVDAVIQNTASFEQSFPVLDVVFTDNRDKVVSARRLTPSEYLGGELSGRKNMPKLQPIHIAIEIADPGENATGYKIIIVN